MADDRWSREELLTEQTLTMAVQVIMLMRMMTMRIMTMIMMMMRIMTMIMMMMMTTMMTDYLSNDSSNQENSGAAEETDCRRGVDLI